MSGPLNLDTIASGQLQPYQTSNDADSQLESAMTLALSVDLSAGDHVLTGAEFTRSIYFASTGNVVTRILTTPATNRLFAVHNGGTSALTVKTGSTTLSVVAGATGLFYTDGTTNGLVAVVVGSASPSAPFANSVSDAPGASVNNYAPTGWDASQTHRERRRHDDHGTRCDGGAGRRRGAAQQPVGDRQPDPGPQLGQLRGR